jgi:RNA polymerase sigma-70 factor, ECF subfamily
LSRTPAAEASVAVDVYAEYAESGQKTVESLADTPRRRARTKAERRAIAPSAAFDAKPARGAVVARVSTLTDQELLEGLRGQSEPHFAELYSRYFQRIYNFVYARIRNHVECEEIVQETFIAVFRSFENYRGQSSLLSWIYGIAKNTTNNSLRRARTQNERIELVEESELVPSASLLRHPSPDELLDLHRFGDELSERLEQVADWQAEIFAMRHLENLSIPEISKRTNRTSDAVRSSLYRVKRIFFETALPGGGGHFDGDRGESDRDVSAEDPA